MVGELTACGCLCVQEGEREGSLELRREGSQGDGGGASPCDSLSQSGDEDTSEDDNLEQQHLLSHQRGRQQHSFTPLHAKGRDKEMGPAAAHDAACCAVGSGPTFMDKLRAMLGSVHIVLFLLQATLFGYGFGGCRVEEGTLLPTGFFSSAP